MSRRKELKKERKGTVKLIRKVDRAIQELEIGKREHAMEVDADIGDLKKAREAHVKEQGRINHLLNGTPATSVVGGYTTPGTFTFEMKA